MHPDLEWRERFDPFDVRCLEAIERLSSFTDAAADLGCGQARVSKSVMRLESIVGSRLVDRTSPVALTPVGQEVLAGLRRAVAELDSTVGLGGGGRVQAEPTRIVLLPSLSSWLVHAISAGIADGDPACAALSLVERHQARLESSLVAGSADLGVGDLTGAGQSLYSHPLFRDRFVVALREDDPLARLRTVPVSALEGRTLVHLTRDSSLRRTLGAVMRSRRIRTQVGLEVSSFSALHDAVVVGIGVAVIPRIAADLGRPGLDFRTIVAPSITRQIGLLATTAPSSGAVRQLVRLLRSAGAPKGTL